LSKAAYLRMMQVVTNKVALGSAGDCGTRTQSSKASAEDYPQYHVISVPDDSAQASIGFLVVSWKVR
jgi:hypothetical protein